MITIIKKGPDTCFFSDGIQLARAVGKEGWLDSFEEKAPGVYRRIIKGRQKCVWSCGPPIVRNSPWFRA